MTLTEFLLARFAEDEADARAAIHPDRPGTHWHWVDPEDDTLAVFDSEHYAFSLRTVEEFPTTSGVGDLPAFIIHHAEADHDTFVPLPHIARHDPARVLAECEAKRRIAELHVRVDYMEAAEFQTACLACRDDAWPCGTLRALALPYADHPDYPLNPQEGAADQ